MSSQASLSPQEVVQHLCLCPSTRFLCCLKFSWYPCPYFLQHIHFVDESVQHRELLEEGRDLMWHKQESFAADGHLVAGYVSSNHSVDFARPSSKWLVINFDMPVKSDSSRCSFSWFIWTGTKCHWPFTSPLTACEGLFRMASPHTHSGSQP